MAMSRLWTSLRWLLIYVLLPSSLSIACYHLYRHSFFLPQVGADVIFSHAVIYTGDSGVPRAEAMAVKRGRVLEIGPSSKVEAMAGPKTQLVDLHGKVLVPGFIDSHLHLISGGLQMARIELHDIGTQAEFISKIREFVQGLGGQAGKWVLGGGWNNEKWGGELPQASWIDPFTNQFPVWLSRSDGHMGLANSLAMRLSGVDGTVADPEGGSIIKDEYGVPTGVLADSAMELVAQNIPKPSLEERREALSRASRHALSQGVTAVVDLGRYFPGSEATKVWDDFHEVYKWVDQLGELLLRVSVFFPLVSWHRVLDTFSETGYKLSEHLQVGGLKAFADGSLGSSTALFNEPYENDPTNYGLEVSSQDSILEHLVEADKRKLQVAIHAIGDAANDKVLDTFQNLIVMNGERPRRLRIEHAQHLSQEALPRFSSLGVIASMQPEQLLDDANYADKKLGVERSLRESYLLKSLLENGTILALGSDWPVASLRPLKGMQAAVTRLPDGWTAPWMPSECIDIEAAFRGYTYAAAYASFREDDIGSLSVGKFADFAVLSGDLFKDLDQIEVLETYVGGVKVFSKTRA